MLKSMTGFGKASGDSGHKSIYVEIRSLNSKQLDLNLKLPLNYKVLEAELRNSIAKIVERGKVDFSITCEQKEMDKALAINKNLAVAYFKELKDLAQELNTSSNELFSIVMKLPDVMKRDGVEIDAEEKKAVLLAVEKGLNDFLGFRAAEGKVLENEFKNRIQIISGLLEEVEKLDKNRAVNIRSRIEKNVEELIQKDRIDQNRLEQELIFYIEKMDITEEKLRLKTHLDYFTQTMKDEDSVGRKLGFISQEIGREINTIGSKANDSSIQKVVVQMKDELEKIKEQLLNVL